MVSFPDQVRSAEATVISGPPKTGGYRLFHHLLVMHGDRPVVIATGKPAEEIRNHHAELAAESRPVRVVDCVSSGRGEMHDDEMTRYVDSPGNLTAIGVKVTELLDELADQPATAVGLYSISQLLMHAGLEQTYQFTHILAQQAAAANIPFVAVINDRAHDDQTVNAIYERFDSIIETREVGGRNQFRTRSSLEGTDWQDI